MPDLERRRARIEAMRARSAPARGAEVCGGLLIAGYSRG